MPPLASPRGAYIFQGGGGGGGGAVKYPGGWGGGGGYQLIYFGSFKFDLAVE